MASTSNQRDRTAAHTGRYPWLPARHLIPRGIRTHPLPRHDSYDPRQRSTLNFGEQMLVHVRLGEDRPGLLLTIPVALAFIRLCQLPRARPTAHRVGSGFDQFKPDSSLLFLAFYRNAIPQSAATSQSARRLWLRIRSNFALARHWFRFARSILTPSFAICQCPNESQPATQTTSRPHSDTIAHDVDTDRRPS